MQNQPQLAQISQAAFAAKFQSKREVYRFLSSEVRAYLPSYETVTIWHLRDLAMGSKTIIPCDDVKVIDVPQFEGLSIQDIFAFAQHDRDVERALPPGKEIQKLSRAYLANVIYTIMGQNFQNWVNAQVNLRNQRVAQEGNNMISMDPQIAQIFQQSTAISGKLHPSNSCIPHSLQGQVQPPHEGLRGQEEVQGPDPAGEARGAAAGGRDRRQDGRVRAHEAGGGGGEGHQGAR